MHSYNSNLKLAGNCRNQDKYLLLLSSTSFEVVVRNFHAIVLRRVVSFRHISIHLIIYFKTLVFVSRRVQVVMLLLKNYPQDYKSLTSSHCYNIELLKASERAMNQVELSWNTGKCETPMWFRKVDKTKLLSVFNLQHHSHPLQKLGLQFSAIFGRPPR